MAHEKNRGNLGHPTRGDLGHPLFIKIKHEFSFLAPIGKLCPLTCLNHRNSPNKTLQAAYVKYYVLYGCPCYQYHLVIQKIRILILSFYGQNDQDFV